MKPPFEPTDDPEAVAEENLDGYSCVPEPMSGLLYVVASALELVRAVDVGEEYSEIYELRPYRAELPPLPIPEVASVVDQLLLEYEEVVVLMPVAALVKFDP